MRGLPRGTIVRFVMLSETKHLNGADSATGPLRCFTIVQHDKLCFSVTKHVPQDIRPHFQSLLPHFVRVFVYILIFPAIAQVALVCVER